MGGYNREELKAKIKVMGENHSPYIGTSDKVFGNLKYLLVLSYLESIEALLEKLVGGDPDENIS